MKEMHIAFATDLFYLKPTCVALESVLMASAENEAVYYFYVLMPADKMDVALPYFERIKSRYENCEIQIIEIGNIFENAYLPIAHFTKPAFYRLLLPRLIKQERCIYLDSDIIVCRDLSELYDMDIKGYDLAGVIAAITARNTERAEKIGIPSTNQYVNSGVLLLNLEQMRKDNFVERALELIEMPFPSPDQDIINRVAYQKIKLLPHKYNAPPSLEGYPDTLSNEEVEDIEKRPVILHYAYPEKPWECLDIARADKWWRICRQSLLFQEFMEGQKESMFYYGVITHLSLWKADKYSQKWLDEITKYKTCYIYGAGKIGEWAVTYLKSNNVPITGILVSNLSGNRKSIQGIAVTELTEDIEKDALIFVAVSRKYQLPIRRRLFQYGLFYTMPLNELYNINIDKDS